MRCPYCAGNHPAVRPVSASILSADLSRMLEQAGFVPEEATAVRHAPLDQEHARNPRRYAQVVPNDLLFEFSQAILWLPREHRIGLLAHEVGHCLDPLGGEDGADEAALRVLGIKIGYDPRWPGKGLQTARKKKWAY
jgi:hypothetical protein